MSRMSRLLLWGFLMSGLLLWGRPATGGVNLHFTPADTVIVAGGTGRISVMVDDPVSIRTFIDGTLFIHHNTYGMILIIMD